MSLITSCVICTLYWNLLALIATSLDSMIANGGAICTVVFFILLVSYGVTLHSLKTHGLEGNHKDFYTCESHITVVLLFFVPCIFLYARPNVNFPIDKSMMVIVTFITPMLNPLIYTLRNEEMKNSMRKLWSKNVTLVGRGGFTSYRMWKLFFFPQNQRIVTLSDYISKIISFGLSILFILKQLYELNFKWNIL